MAGWKQRVGNMLAVAATIACPSVSQAQAVELFSVEQRGDFVLVGNTLARDCAADPDLLLVGSVASCGANADDTGADVLWSVGGDGDVPVADLSVEPIEAASSAVLELPDGASVTRAVLHWSAQTGEGDPSRATLGRGELAARISASRTGRSGADGDDYYQSIADVTALVQELGAGPYRVSGIDAASPSGLEDSSYYAGWWLVVFYALESEPLRRLAHYDTFGFVTELAPSRATLAGFEVPPEGIDAKLGVVAFDGDVTSDGDQLRFGLAPPLGVAARLDDSNNFFDSSRRDTTGDPFGAAGDQPRASGAAGSMSGVDLHVVDVGARLEPGQTTAELLATTTADRFFLSGLVLSVATLAPDLSLSTQGVRDVNGPPLRPGDELEYTIVAENVGPGAAPVVTLRAPLSPQVTFVPGSLEIVDGANPGPSSDVADADRGELEVGVAPAIVLRLGEGADAGEGGRLRAGESQSVRFRVVVAPGASGSIVSQAQIGVARTPGGERVDTLTDASRELAGANPTEIAIDDCARDADCSPGFCDVGQSPQRCAAKQPDCDGEIEEGLAGAACNAAIGAPDAGAGVSVSRTGPLEPAPDAEPAPSAEPVPSALRPAPPGLTPVRGGTGPSRLDSAASLGGGGGCQLPRGLRAPVEPGFLIAVAFLVRRLRGSSRAVRIAHAPARAGSAR